MKFGMLYKVMTLKEKYEVCFCNKFLQDSFLCVGGITFNMAAQNNERL